MSRRTEQVAEHLHRLIGDAFVRSLEFPQGTLATITRVEVTPDLRQAFVYVSILPFDKSEEVLSHLIRHRRHIQQEVAEELAMRLTPQIRFIMDTQTESASQIEAIMDREEKERGE